MFEILKKFNKNNIKNINICLHIMILFFYQCTIAGFEIGYASRDHAECKKFQEIYILGYQNRQNEAKKKGKSPEQMENEAISSLLIVCYLDYIKPKEPIFDLK